METKINVIKSNTIPTSKKLSKRIWEQRDLQLMVLPAIILIFIFSYMPMYGIISAFQNYQLGDVMGLSEWVGLKHFHDFFIDPRFFRVMRNTLGISILRLLLGFPIPIIFAVMLNELKGTLFKRSIQTISYLPYFVSWVFVSSIVMTNLLSYDGGLLNYILIKIGSISEPIMFMGEPKYFWLIIVLSDIWKNMGWNAIIYLAAISAIDPELYQAANIDGAGRFDKIFNITLPSIRPTVVILLIFSVAGILNAGFEQIMLFTNNLNNKILTDVSSVLDTYVLETGMRQARYSYATAIGLFRSAASVVLLLIANTISRKVSETSLF